jgi:hypothetical protein
MMRTPTRDLLVLFKHGDLSPDAMEHEMEALENMLFRVETFDNIIIAHELIDVNRYKISSQRHILLRELRNRKERAFVFFFNKN